ncbi:MAG TPA: LuxR C-terminal-related transcriptional regulator [Bacillota bacterium]|nr:LuxR C-terminal-related transcriptional regulator [Bacillota bacterium]
MLRLLATGATNRDIATALHITESTVEEPCEQHPRQAAGGQSYGGRPEGASARGGRALTAGHLMPRRPVRSPLPTMCQRRNRG